jgi:hypothetical protein
MATEERPLQIIADYEKESPRIYANYVQVSMSQIDCTIAFCDVVGPMNDEEALQMQKTGTLGAPVRAVMVIPNQIVDGLIHALQAQRDKQAGTGKSTGTRVQ